MVRTSCRAFAVLLTCTCLGTMLIAQEKKVDAAATPQAQGPSDEMMKKWNEVKTPGEFHKKLDELVGTWDVESRALMGGPGSEPTVSHGTAQYAWVLGGRFLREDFTSEMMGIPVTGLGYTGYDIVKKKYVGIWLDNTATAMYTMEGTVDQSGKVFTLFGTVDEWMTGEHSKMTKYVIRIIDHNKHVMEIHDLSLPEPGTKVVEFTYTRKQQ